MKKLVIILMLIGFSVMNGIVSAEPIFFPISPNEPKIQHLFGFSSTKEIRSAEHWFVRFVLGESKRNDRVVNPYGIKMFNGKIFFCEPSLRQVTVVDLTNKELKQFGEAQLSHPVNLDADNEKIYVADKEGKIAVYDWLYKFLTAYGTAEQFAPVAVRVMGEKLVVADIKDHEIEVLNKRNGLLMYKFGGKGTEAGKFKFPIDLAVKENHLYVTDMMNFRIQVFAIYNDRAEHILSYGTTGPEYTNLNRPKGIAIDPEGRIWLTDVIISNAVVTSSVVKVFNALPYLQNSNESDDFVLAFGGEGGGTRPSDVFMPVGLAVTDDPQDLKVFKPYLAEKFEPEFLILLINRLQNSAKAKTVNTVNIYAWGKKRN